MFTNEAKETVLNAVEDIGYCCALEDDYHEWSDIAASSIQAFLEDLSAEQLDDTCEAFREYIIETAKKDENLAGGVKDALTICLNEMLDYIGDVLEDDDDSEDEYLDEKETAYLVKIIKAELNQLDIMNV